MNQNLMASEIWQHSPKKNLIEGESVKECKKPSRKIPLYLRASDYPDLRFSCPNCGTLEVLIEWKNFETLKGNCLECQQEWLKEECS